MHCDIQPFAEYAVTPFVGVWIETNFSYLFQQHILSHPSWVCGLKLEIKKAEEERKRVTPFVGVWIETMGGRVIFAFILVTPFVGVWIETIDSHKFSNLKMSHPSWVCGLKPMCGYFVRYSCASHPSWVCGLKLQVLEILLDYPPVTPFVGVWIETNLCRCIYL